MPENENEISVKEMTYHKNQYPDKGEKEKSEGARKVPNLEAII